MSDILTLPVPFWSFGVFAVAQMVINAATRARLKRLEDIPRQQIAHYITSGRITPEYAAEVIGKALRQRGAK